MKWELPALPFKAEELAPNISKQTIEFHYGKHHQAYVNNLNGFVEGTKFANSTLEDIIKNSSGALFNNAAQVWNHTFYFEQFSAKAKQNPEGNLLDAIVRDFGSFDEFKDQFDKAAISLFGSGWVWLSQNNDGKLIITQESNAGTPITKNEKPLLTCDVWEHAYYLDYQNRRADYIKGFWNILDWNVIEQRFK